MANHKSALKRIRSNEKRKTRNRYYSKSMRSAVKKFRAINDKNEAVTQLPSVISLIDRLAKKAMIHKNKASNLKSKLMKKVNAL